MGPILTPLVLTALKTNPYTQEETFLLRSFSRRYVKVFLSGVKQDLSQTDLSTSECVFLLPHIYGICSESIGNPQNVDLFLFMETRLFIA